MVVRKRRRKNKLLGQRTRGHGDTKNMRGSGTRGGKGLAGSHKHKWTKYYKKFGTEKKKIRSRKVVRAINIDQLMEMVPRLVAEGKVSKESGMIVVDGPKIGFDKLLSRGILSEKIVVKNMKASAKAIEKIEKAGGRFEGGKEAEAGEEVGESDEEAGSEEEEGIEEDETKSKEEGSEENEEESKEDADETEGERGKKSK